MKIRHLALLALLAVVISCRTVPVTGRRQLILIPPSEMYQMSYTQYSQFLQQNKLSTDREKTEMIRRIGTRIQTAVETYMAEKGLGEQIKDFRWEFNLVEDNTVNAWCMPGGKVVFYTGILPVCQNENAIAVVMGHEVAHAIAEHGAERMSQGLVQQLGVAGLSIALSQKPQLTQNLWMQAFGVGSNLGILSFSRQHESEADDMGIIFAAMAGYDPREAVPFWQRMASLSGGQSPPEFMSTHPSSETRVANLQAKMPEAVKLYEQYKNKY